MILIIYLKNILWIKFGNKLGLQLSLKKKTNMTTYFENLTVRLHNIYVLNTHFKFFTNRMLFTI